MRKIAIWTVIALLCALLCGCGGEGQPAESTPTPEPTEDPFVDLGGLQIDVDTESLDLSRTAFDADKLLENSARLTALREIDLGEVTLPYAQYAALCEAFPHAEICYSVRLFDRVLGPEEETLDLADMRPEQTEELVAALPYLPALREINFVNGEGVCVYSLEEIPLLDQVRAAAPQARLRVCFDLFGQRVSSEDTRIEYLLVPIGNEGAEQVRAVLPYLCDCEYFLMDGCDVDNEVMARLRDDFPETKIVWRVWLTEPDYRYPALFRKAGFLTDTTRIRSTLINDENCGVLKYCTETKYVDFGHNFGITDFSFLGYMPKLEVCIIAITNVSDLTPLMNCPELEYLEVYGTQVTDLSPLAACTKLKHLNISRLPQVTDMTCLYGLELERLRAVNTGIPREQIDEYARLHPDCEMLMDGYAPHLNGWRYDDEGRMVPRYKLLREQMEYDIDFSYGIP